MYPCPQDGITVPMCLLNTFTFHPCLVADAKNRFTQTPHLGACAGSMVGYHIVLDVTCIPRNPWTTQDTDFHESHPAFD